MTAKTRSLLAIVSTFVLGSTAVLVALIVAMPRNDASAQAAAPSPLQTLNGTVVTWNAPCEGWKPYDQTTITRLGVDVDECIQNETLKATVCVKVLDGKKVGGPLGAVNGLFEKFHVDPEDRPRIVLNGTRASFSFSMESGIVADAMDIKVTADKVGSRKDKVLMVMGAWTSGAGKFDAKGFDLLTAKTCLR
jgi:hypothetical protein